MYEMYDYLPVNMAPSASYCREVERFLGMGADIIEQIFDTTFFLVVIQLGIQVNFIVLVVLSVITESFASFMTPHEPVVGAESLR